VLTEECCCGVVGFLDEKPKKLTGASKVSSLKSLNYSIEDKRYE